MPSGWCTGVQRLSSPLKKLPQQGIVVFCVQPFGDGSQAPRGTRRSGQQVDASEGAFVEGSLTAV